MKSHQNLVKIVLILFITFFTPIIDENSLQASDLYKKNLGIATWANDTTLSGWQNNLGWKTHSKQYMKKYEIENNGEEPITVINVGEERNIVLSIIETIRYNKLII